MVSLSCCHVQVRAVSSLRVDLSLEQLKVVNLILKTVRPCCVFHSLYMTCSFQIVNWYLGSVLLFAEKERMVEEKVAEKDKRIAEKDQTIQILQESADVATALRETRRAETGRKWGK
jgi:hypothetical protein